MCVALKAISTLIVVAAIVVTLPQRGHAQSITNLSVVKNAGNSADDVTATLFDLLADRYERTTTVGVLSSNATSFTTRYAEIVGADVDLLSVGARTITQNTDYTITFDVTAPGTYSLTVATDLVGALTLHDDGVSAAADVGALTGGQTGGTLASGSLSLADPGALSGTTSGDTPFAQSGVAVIEGVSNGVAQTHTLTFTWTASCTSTGVLGLLFGDECAVRLGIPTAYTDTAGDYPGAGSRAQSDDGHFVSVTLTSLCGNTVLNPGEECDDGNNANGDCCAANCEVENAGTVCRASAGTCDLVETCDGISASCPADAVLSAGTSCRPSVGDCDVAEVCDGTTGVCPPDELVDAGTSCRTAVGPCDAAESCTGAFVDCPADGVAPAGTTCRAAADLCDVAETCDGSTTTCPADQIATAGATCRAVADLCDVAETCDGVGITCPTDELAGAGAACRPSLGPCDVAESCTGAFVACPADVVAAAGTSCRASAGPCDVAETCTGSSGVCPADGFVASTVTCRAAAGACDVVEKCTGASAACPSDALAAGGTVCRAVAGGCDVAETCGGASTACPADTLAAAGTVCRPVADACDAAESCTGSSAACPADVRPFDADADGTCDADDSCPNTSNPFQADGDGDGLGDACDPCTNMVPIFTDTVKLRLTRVLAPAGDDKLRLAGTLRLTPPLQSKFAPLTYGARVLVVTKDGRPVLDVTLPNTPYSEATRSGWTGRGNGRSFVYRNRGAEPLGGLVRVVLRKTSVPGGVRFVVRGKLGTYPVAAAELPLHATVILDAPFATTGACAETPSAGACAARAGGSSVRCRW